MKGSLEVRKEGFAGLWRDLFAEPDWRYEESPPFLLPELTNRDLFEVGDTELARTLWFWSRRPKPKLPESALLVMGALFAFLSLTIPFVYWPLTSIPTCSAEVIILLFDLLVARCTIVHRLAFLHWRREYELSIDRLIRIADKGHEGGSSIAW